VCPPISSNVPALTFSSTAVPYIFATQYDFSALATGLVFLGLSAGYIVAACGVVTLALYRRRRLQKMIAAKQKPSPPAPEAQLLLGKTGSPAIVVSLFVLGWTAHAKVHWMVPVVALGVYGCGFILVFVSRPSIAYVPLPEPQS